MQTSNKIINAVLLAMVVALTILVVEALWTDTREQESYRNDAAIHMMETGNYSVAYQFGDRYLFKPPGTNWAIVLASLPFGTVTDFSGRIPILLLYLLLPLAMYGLIRDRFSVEASVTAAAASVLYLPWFIENGPIMELDLLFSFFVVLSQAAWFYFHRNGSHLAKWIAGHLFLAAAFLIKGPPAFLFFYGTIVMYQVCFSESSTNWWAVLAGLFAFLVPTGGWFISTLNQVSAAEWWEVMVSQMAGPAQMKLETWEVYYHYVSYPVETIGSFFPWILFLVPLASASFRTKWYELWDERPILGFCVAALPVWLVFYPLPGSDIRYILPIYPWLGIMAASILDTPQPALNNYASWALGLRRFLWVVFVLLAIALPFLLPGDPSHPWYVVAGTMTVFVLVAGVIARYTFHTESYRNLVVCSLISILTIKAAYLFVFAPVDKPDWFGSKQFVAGVADYLEKNDIRPCLSTDKTAYYYLHQRFRGITDCDSTPVSPDTRWVLDNDRPEDKNIRVRKTFTHPRFENLYLYRHRQGG